MIKANIHTATRIIDIPCADDRNQAISALQNAVSQLTEEDGRCRFVVLDNDHNKEIYSWEYQPTFRKDLEMKKEKKAAKVSVTVEEKESNYEWAVVYYILKNGKELDYDNFYRDEFDCAKAFDDKKSAHEFMKERGYGQHEYSLVYEYCVWPKDKDTVCSFGLGLTEKEARKDLNDGLKYYDLKLLANKKIKEL